MAGAVSYSPLVPQPGARRKPEHNNNKATSQEKIARREQDEDSNSATGMDTKMLPYEGDDFSIQTTPIVNDRHDTGGGNKNNNNSIIIPARSRLETAVANINNNNNACNSSHNT